MHIPELVARLPGRALGVSWTGINRPFTAEPTKHVFVSCIKSVIKANRVREELNTAKFGWFHIKAILVAGIGYVLRWSLCPYKLSGKNCQV